jgi:hypothetical protein
MSRRKSRPRSTHTKASRSRPGKLTQAFLDHDKATFGALFSRTIALQLRLPRRCIVGNGKIPRMGLMSGTSGRAPPSALARPIRTAPKMKSSDHFFDVTRRAMLSALAALPALPMLVSGSAQAQSGAGTLPSRPGGQTPVTDPLPSWNDSASKTAIFNFVERVTKQGSPDFVPEADRIATFDNDGTLWAEQPMYFQVMFALEPPRGPRGCSSIGMIS